MIWLSAWMNEVRKALVAAALHSLYVEVYMRSARSQCLALLCFLLVVTLILANGFAGVAGKIFAQEDEPDVFRAVEPVGHVLDEILDNYYEYPDLDRVVEGALIGMMNSLDKHSAYIPKKAFEDMKEDTEGEFEGIGVSIALNEHGFIEVVQPIAGSPAAKAGMLAGDIIVAIDGVSTRGIGLTKAAGLIKGRRGTKVLLEVLRRFEEEGQAPKRLEFEIKRGRIPIESVKGARVLDEGIGHLWLGDFKKKTAKEIEGKLKELTDEGMSSLILDLRWNPGGLLTAAKEVCDLFLPKNTLVTYTKERRTGDGSLTEDMRLYTDRSSGPVLPENLPMIILVNKQTASSSEIVTGALQYYERAIILGEKTWGKGSVQTIIPLRRPPGSALRLTTALYYTPAEVTINHEGIKPDVEVVMDQSDQGAVFRQMYEFFAGITRTTPLTGEDAENGEGTAEETVGDVQLERAIEILSEDPVFENLLVKYHKDPSETQVAAAEDADEEAAEEEAAAHEAASGLE